MTAYGNPKSYYKNYLKSQYVDETLSDFAVKDVWGEIYGGGFNNFVKSQVAEELNTVEKNNPSIFKNCDNQMMIFLAVLVVLVIIFCILIYVIQKDNSRKGR